MSAGGALNDRTCPECRAPIPPKVGSRCRCRATIVYLNGFILLVRTFYTGMRGGMGLRGARLWCMLYHEEENATWFYRRGERQKFPGYVSHKRFVKLIPFL